MTRLEEGVDLIDRDSVPRGRVVVDDLAISLCMALAVAAVFLLEARRRRALALLAVDPDDRP